MQEELKALSLSGPNNASKMISVLVCEQQYKLKSVTSRTQPYARFVIHTSISLASEIYSSKTLKHRSIVFFIAYFFLHLNSVTVEGLKIVCISIKTIISNLFEPKIDGLSFNLC